MNWDVKSSVMFRFLLRDKQKDTGSVEELQTLYVHNKIKNKMCGLWWKADMK